MELLGVILTFVLGTDILSFIFFNWEDHQAGG